METVDNAIALDEAASAPLSLSWGWNVASSLLMSVAGAGAHVRLLFEVDEDEVLFRKRGMVDARTQRLLSCCKPSIRFHSSLYSSICTFVGFRV